MIPNEETALRAYLGQDPASFPVNWMVEAGAGAGKTFLIVQRMVSQLASGYCQPEQLVAITFTNKAANQLRDRLTDALLQRRAAATAPTEKENLDRALQQSDAIQISTVHSFCQRLLREMPLAAGLPFSFTLQEAEDTQRDGKRFFEKCCLEHGDWFDTLRACAVQPDSLKDAFLSLLNCGDDEIVQYDAAAFPAPAQQFCQLAEASRQKLVQPFPAGWQPGWGTPLLEQLLSYPPITTPEQAAGWLNLLKDFADRPLQPRKAPEFSLPIFRPHKGGRTYTAATFSAGLVISPDSPVVAPWKSYYDACGRLLQANIALEKARRAKSPSEETCQQAQKDKTDAANQVKAWMNRPACTFVSACYTLLGTRKEALSALQQPVNQLLHTVILQALLRCRDALREYRAAHGQLGYDDLLLRCRDLLKNSPEARTRLAARQLILYVDEFQDTDPIQAEILFYLTAGTAGFSPDWTGCIPRPGSLFLVGDPKQSIYRFRRADIAVYNRVRTLFDGNCPHCRLALLRFNFRSSKALCEYATKTFEPLMTGKDGQPGFLAMEARDRQVPDRTVWNWNADPRTAPAGVAAWIDQAVAGGQARWQDFLILCDRKDQVERYRNALRARQIPVNATGQHLLADTVPLARCAHWCRYLLHPRDPAGAAALLVRSGISPALLYTLQQTTGKPLAGLLKDSSGLDGLDAALQPAVRMLGRMALLRQKARILPPMALLEELLSGDYGLWDGAPDPESYGWVRTYLAQLRQWSDQSLTGLLNRAIRLCDARLEHPMAYTGSANEVQVMNLHKAKGLEGRIVFLAPGVRKSPAAYRHLQGGKAWLCLKTRLPSPDGGWLPVSVLPPDWDAQKEEENKQAGAERTRLLYVAATRARELLLVGHKPADGSRGADAWKGLNGQETLTPDTPDLLPGIPARALFEPQCFPPHTAAAAPALPDHGADTALRQGLAALPEAARVAVTPSKLDHPAPPPTLDPETEVSALPEPPAGPDRPDPHGGDWGTIIHRTLELAVTQSSWSPEDLEPLALQAVRETLPENVPLTPRQYRQLTGGQASVPYARLAANLACRAKEACAPLLADGAPLRALLAQGTAVAEYPFYLSVSASDGELYRHLVTNLPQAPAGALPIDLNGILDLAIQTPEGWTVVDYKTDRPAPGETEAQYCHRLRSHYAPQLRTYALVLERLEHRPVRCFVCAVPLGGRLLELREPPAPVADCPAPPKKDEPLPAADGGLHFSDLLYDHALRPAVAPADGAGGKNEYPGLDALVRDLRKKGCLCTRKQNTLEVNGQRIQIRFRDDVQGAFAQVDQGSLIFAIRKCKSSGAGKADGADTYTMIIGSQSELGASTTGSWSLSQNRNWREGASWQALNQVILKKILEGGSADE